MNDLTKKQQIIFDYIKKSILKNGYPPTVREIASDLGLSSPATIHAHLTKLEEKGFIRKDNSKNRAIELLKEKNKEPISDLIAKVPLLGKVTAGNPIEAINNPDEFFDLPTYLIPRSKEVFTLLVKGESMINVGIYDGDIVIIEKTNQVRNGEIVVAMTDENEVTLKTFYKEMDHVRLQPENDSMSPIILKNVTILGKAIGLYRKL